MAQTLNEQVSRLKELMKIETNQEIMEVNEGLFDSLKTATAGIAGGVSGAVKGMVQGAKNGANTGKLDALYKQASSVFNKIHDMVGQTDPLFDKLEEYKNRLNSLNVDQQTKEKYFDLIAGIQQVKTAVLSAVQNHVDGSSTYNAGQDVTSQQQQTQPRPEPKAEPAPQQPQAKVFDIRDGQVMQDLDDYLANRKNARAAVSENTLEEELLDEARMEGKFHELFRMLMTKAPLMAQHLNSQDMDTKSIAQIMSLAFETILNKGQKGFIDDIAEINNGYNTYKKAYTNLKRVQATQQSQPTGQDRTAEAEQVAGDFLKQHGYPVTPENIKQATEYILKHKDF